MTNIKNTAVFSPEIYPSRIQWRHELCWITLWPALKLHHRSEWRPKNVHIKECLSQQFQKKEKQQIILDMWSGM